MLKKIYSCDICRTDKQTNELTGLNFNNLRDFKFSQARDTDGIHICNSCIANLKREILQIKPPA